MAQARTSFVDLAVPLLQDQIAAARRLYKRLDQWNLSDRALSRLRQSIPGFEPEACLMKALAINELYDTNVWAIIPMSRHVHRTLSGIDFAAQGVELVDRVAAFSYSGRETKCISFASKFCHFFIDQERFPLYDKAARSAIKLHLGRESVNDATYAALLQNLERLRNASKIQGNVKDIDRYLWIVGSYIHWKGNLQINAEVRRVFENPLPDERHDLEELLPAPLKKE